ncbi:uncharacterized protein LOC114541746 [Dendronephthya gigantea]|uniref:uncharacterized protein LOC114541746 n=1 Tax=Dendronephthya gigantea TaxID=151771 RepID=UPI001069FADF|nr:uncharacterized protein LOC114541746 [Dendronephthya gigantea]
MKNARQVCTCTDVGELYFDGMPGSILVGCQNTPGKKSRFCTEHENSACSLRDDSAVMMGEPASNVLKDEDTTDVLPMKIVNERQTRQGMFHEVLWSNSSKTWVKKIHLPKKLLDAIRNGCVYKNVRKDTKEFGQTFSVLEECMDDKHDGGSMQCF